MGISERDEFGLENGTQDSLNYSHSASSEWRFGGLVLPGNVDIVRNQEMGGCSSSTAPMVETFSSSIWEQAANSENLGFCHLQGHTNGSASNAIANSCGIDRTLDINWNLSPNVSKGAVYRPNIPGVFPPALSQLPADSSFIERAARFSSFGNGNFGDIIGPFNIESGVFSRGLGAIPEKMEDFPRNGFSSVSGCGGQPQKNAPANANNEAPNTERSSSKIESPLKLDGHGKQSADGSADESEEAEFSGGNGLGEPSMMEVAGLELSAKGIGSRKRKSDQTEHDQDNEPLQKTSVSAKDNTEIQRKGDQNPSSTTIKNTGKLGKQGSQPLDSPKEGYIHVRARRGQATNSHSLAERVRREKISERMKFLQELVPGCSKVTGKAVMLDEIINYVQSLQRQVEFLSMKLATVNPTLDINIDSLLTEDILQSRIGPLSPFGFSPHMPDACPPPHFSHHGLTPASFPAIRSSEMLRTTMNSQLTPKSGEFKEPAQIKNVWDGELQNLVQMSFGTTTTLSNCLEVDGSDSAGNTKVKS